MNDDINKKMGLDLASENSFQEEVKTQSEKEITLNQNNFDKNRNLNTQPEEENIFKEKTNTTKDLYEKNEYSNNKNEIFSEKKLESLDSKIESSQNKNIKNKVSKKDSKKEKAPKGVVKSLSRGIWWTFILILAILFGIESIWDFGNKFSDFIKAAKEANVSGDFSDVSSAINKFFISLSYVFEAILFLFLILYSTKMMFKNYKPWIIYRKSTEYNRYKDKIFKAKMQIKYLQNELNNQGSKTKLKFVSIEESEEFLPVKNGEKIGAKKYYSDLKKEINHLINKQKKINQAIKEVKDKNIKDQK